MKKVNGKWQAEQGVKASDNMIYAMIMPKKGGCGWDYNASGREVMAIVKTALEAAKADEVVVSQINTDIREFPEAKADLRNRVNELCEEAGFERMVEAPKAPKVEKPKRKVQAPKPRQDDLQAAIAEAEAMLARLRAMAG
jgi:hypothetical protein